MVWKMGWKMGKKSIWNLAILSHKILLFPSKTLWPTHCINKFYVLFNYKSLLFLIVICLGFKFFWSFLGKPFDVTIVYWEANMMCNPKSYSNSCDSFIGLVSSCFLELAMIHQQFINMESRIWYRYFFHKYYWILPR